MAHYAQITNELLQKILEQKEKQTLLLAEIRDKLKEEDTVVITQLPSDIPQ